MKNKLSLALALVLLLSALPSGSLAAGRSYGNIPIYIGYVDVDYMAEELLKEIPTQGKDARGQIQAVYDWIIQHCKRYDWDGTYYFDLDEVMPKLDAWAKGLEEKMLRGEIVERPEYEDTTIYDPASGMHLLSYDSNYYIASFASEMMLRRTGNCAHFSALLALLLGHLGFDCRLIPGEFINGNGSTAEHKWNYVLVDGSYYWLDVRMDHASSSGGKLTHTYFMVSDTGKWAKRHNWDHSYSDWLAANAPQLAEDYARYGIPKNPQAAVQPEVPTAEPKVWQVTMDGTPVNFATYALPEGEGTVNYVRVRDLAVLLSGTAAQFDVVWDGKANLVTGTAYTGSPGAAPFNTPMAYELLSEPTYVNGVPRNLEAIRITYDGAGYTYYKLRDLAEALGFNVGWTLQTGMFLETDKPYDPAN